MSDHETVPAGTDPLVRAAYAARIAPSIHNTQPWRWRLHGPALELCADRGRQLRAIDPDGRMLTISCGAALHHARVALAALGWRCQVDRFPEGAPSDLLARLTLAEHTEVDPATIRLYQTTLIRQTDRRPVPDRRVDPARVCRLETVAAAEGANLQVLRPDQVIELAIAVSRAEAAEAVDRAQREELAQWVGGVRKDGLGIPDSAIPADLPRTTVPEREFGRAGTLPAGQGHDTHAVYAVLHGDDDRPLFWLRGGEAMSAVWLAAVEEGLSLLPLSAPVEVAGTRQALRQLLAEVGYPYMVVRFGVADYEQAGPPHTPRLAATDLVVQLA